MKYPKSRLAAAIMLTLSATALSLAGTALPQASAADITSRFTPGLPWFDAGGHLIQGHNGSIIKDQSNYYWIGQNATDGRSKAACYESPDLEHWTQKSPDVVDVADLAQTWSPSPSIYYLIGNTQVMYDSATDRYVLWVSVSIKGLHSEPRPNSDFLVDVAETAAGQNPCSQYAWQRTTPWQPFGHPVGDIGLMTHSSGGTTYAYLTDADQSGPELRVFLITPDSGTGVTCGDVCLEGTVLEMDGSFEAPALFQAGNVFFMLASHKTSWVPNANQYNYTTHAPPTSTKQSEWDGWQGQTGSGAVPDTNWTDVVPASNPAPTASYTCDSQTFFVLPIHGTSQQTNIYMGDRWDSSNIPNGSLADSSYVWLPLKMPTSTSLQLDCTITNWSIDLSTGDWATLADPTFTFTNVGNSTVIDGKSDGTLVQDQLGTSPTKNQQWEIINVPDSAETGPLYTPWYEIKNAATEGNIVLLCQAIDSGGSPQCFNYLNPLQQALAPPPPGDAYSGIWQFVSVHGGPGLTLASFVNGNLVDAGPDGTLVQDPAANPPAVSQQWTLTCATNC